MPRKAPPAKADIYIVQAHVSAAAGLICAACPSCGRVLLRVRSGKGRLVLPCASCTIDVRVDLV